MVAEGPPAGLLSAAKASPPPAALALRCISTYAGAARAGFLVSMLRLSLVLIVVLSLAACSSAPPNVARVGGASSRSEHAFRTMPPGSPRFVDHSIGREEISIQAMSLVGVPYRWGGNTPESGFDCSGLVRYVVARAADVELPRTTADISRRGESIAPDEIAPGDLIFFNTTGRAHSHVGIYVGKLQFVNAPSTGGTVRLDYLTNPYWAKRFDGIRRVAPPLERPSPFDAPTELAATPSASSARAGAPVRETATAERTPRTRALSDAGGQAPLSAAARPTPTVSADAADVTAAPGAMVRAAPSPAPGAGVLARPTASTAPDPIDAAADAFEPPPPVAVQAERQARRAGASPVQPIPMESSVQLMRASSTPHVQAAPTSTADDPIAQFANSSN